MHLSIVVPLFNEVESLRELKADLDAMTRSLGSTYEILFVDDGSSDGSLALLRELHAADPEHVRVLSFRRSRQGFSSQYSQRRASR